MTYNPKGDSSKWKTPPANIIWDREVPEVVPNIQDAEIDMHLLRAWVAMMNASTDRGSIPVRYQRLAVELCSHIERRYRNDPYNGALFAEGGFGEELNEAHLDASDLLHRWREAELEGD